MSLVVDDPQPNLEKNISSRTTGQIDRHMTRANTKTGRQLRLDSPTTIEACQQLGILVDDLKQKTIEDFRDPKVDEEVISLRFSHYMHRYNQNMIDVMSRKRQLVKAKQKNQKQQELANGSNTERPKIMISEAGLPPLKMSATPNGMKHSSSVSNMIPSPMWGSYNKAMNYLKTSHETPRVKDPEDVIESEERGTFMLTEASDDQFDYALGLEVSRFNKLKRQKQKEAKDAFDNEIRRVKTVQELREKTLRMQEREKKIAAERKIAEEEKKRKAEDKLEQIREINKQYHEQRLVEKEKQKKKLEETKKKLAVEAEEKRRQIMEHEENLEMRRKIAEEKRVMLKIQEQEKCDQLKAEIDAKLYGSQERHSVNMFDKTSRVKYQLEKIEDQAKKMKEKQEQTVEENVQKLVEKLVKKEEAIRSFQQQQLKELKKREQDIAEKTKRFDGHKSNINQAHKDRMQEINERFQKVQENLAAKKAEEEKSLRLKQELTKLKILDKQENYNRQQRQIAYERQQVLDKEKQDHLKLIALKQQREILKQAKMETTIQSKIEKDRIEYGAQMLSKLTKDTTTLHNLNEQQKKLLKEIFRPEDYQEIENEEKRYREEQAAIAEAKKNGLPIPQTQTKGR